MSVRPLPGASYHTFDIFPYTDIEALDHFDTPPGYDIAPFDEKNGLDTFHHGCRCQQQHQHQQHHQHLHHARDRRQRRTLAPPVLLSVIVLICLAFVASAFWQYSSNSWPLPDVPGRHASLADRLSSAFRTESERAMVNEHYNNALEMIDQKIECSSFFSSVGCDVHQIDIRSSLLQTFTLENPSVHPVLVGDSALVLHWQGTNSDLKPVLIANGHAVLDVTGVVPVPAPRSDEPEHAEELMDVQSGVGLLIAVDALIRSGYQPSRTLVLSLMLGDASDAPKVSQYLHDTYAASGLVMDVEMSPPMCRSKAIALRAFHTLVGGVSRAFGALFSTSVSSQASSRPFETDAPRLFRYALDPAAKPCKLTALRVHMSDMWVRLVLGADY